eukprot:407357-Pleurochrysis_carterae.AAC.1
MVRLLRLPQTTLVLPCEVISHGQRSAVVPVKARDTGRTIFEYPEFVPARTATSRLYEHNAMLKNSLILRYCAPRSFPLDDLLVGIYEEIYVYREI